MMRFLSAQEYSLKKLNEQINNSREVNDAVTTSIITEYLLVEEQIEALWIKIEADHEFVLSQVQFKTPPNNLFLHFFSTDSVSTYQINTASPKKIRQGILVIPGQHSYNVSLLFPFRGEWLLVNFSNKWCIENVPENILHTKFKYRWKPIHTHYFDELRALQDAIGPTGKFARKAILSQFIFQCIIDMLHPHSQWDKNIHLNQIKDYLISHLHLPFPSLVFLAELGHMSVSQLKDRFRQAEHSSPQQFFIDKRMEAALNYLIQGLSVKETAFAIGYVNPSNFVNAFKRKYGQSPLRYTKNN